MQDEWERSIGPREAATPRLGFNEARMRAESADGDGVNPLCHAMLLEHGHRSEVAILYLHGYTSCPQQFSVLGQELFERGYNVLAPRYPYHGLADRMNRAQGRLRAHDLLRAADAALDVAMGLGDRVVVMGISLGGLLAGWLAQERSGVDLAVVIAPLFWTKLAPSFLAAPIGGLARLLPPVYVWWDSKRKESLPPPYGYPRFATTGFGALLKVADIVRGDAARSAPLTDSIIVVTNEADPAVDNRTTARVVGDWRRHGVPVVEHEFVAGLGLPHDLLDPRNPEARLDIVNPVLLELVTHGLNQTQPGERSDR